MPELHRVIIMSMNPNQMAYVAIVSTLIFGSIFVGFSGVLQTSEGLGNFDSAVEEDISGDGIVTNKGLDSDDDGLSDVLEETQYGTDPTKKDTDGDGMDDGWEVEHGLNPLDDGESDPLEQDPGEADVEEAEQENETDSWPDPNQGPNGDPDNDGLTNQQEQELETDPQRSDTDNDGLNDKWESDYMIDIEIPGGSFTLFDPLNGNWDCVLLTSDLKNNLREYYNLDDNTPSWEELGNGFGQHSCDNVLDFDDDGLANFQEELFGTDPTSEDSDGDLLTDAEEISSTQLARKLAVGITQGIDRNNQPVYRNCNEPIRDDNTQTFLFDAPFMSKNTSWFYLDDDGDGLLNGPSDWDSDGDGMPDGYEYCYSIFPSENVVNALNLNRLEVTNVLDPSDPSDGFFDWDDDGLNNLEEYGSALLFGAENFTSPWLEDTDLDGMPDGWETNNGLNPRDSSNGDDDPDMDGWDRDGDGSAVYEDLVFNTRVIQIKKSIGDTVAEGETVVRAEYTKAGGQTEFVNIKATSSGTIYQMYVTLDQVITSRDTVWFVVVEDNERFTNEDEYEAKFKNNEPFDENGDPSLIIGRSTDPMNPDTDNDGLIDGIEVFGWEILVVNRGVEITLVVSDPGLPDTDSDGLSDFVEYSSLCDSGSNASNPDTDGDGLDDQFEATGGGGTLQWPMGGGEAYTTSPCAFDTDNDGLEDGEEVIIGKDGFFTHANNSDTDGDGLKDGNEVLYIPRPFQEPTHPLVNDTDQDGMLDGWEMQVQSEEDNTNSHSLWVATSSWNIPNCVPSQTNNCAKSPGGYLWINTLGGFVQEKQFEIYEMNLTGFSVPNNPLCDCNGRWALDPSEQNAIARLPDAVYDIDNDSLLNGAEAPDKWNTNPVDKDSDGDKLFDGWEVKYSQYAIESGLVDNESLSAFGARGVLDPSMVDSDLDGIEDGDEDPDQDGLNRTGLIKRYCPSYNDSSFSDCHIDPDTPDGAQFYQNLANYTNYEEMQNNTNPVSNDTDGDRWNDGPEVYFQDHDDDGMATGWEYHFDFDPYDAADRMFDTDGDGHVNYCEYKWDTNPRDPTSFPGQGELCDPFSE
tara:strand:+ start:2174 stop:5410 length:3237 start_codon:yes stop_codon:yes gene_type:complete